MKQPPGPQSAAKAPTVSDRPAGQGLISVERRLILGLTRALAISSCLALIAFAAFGMARGEAETRRASLEAAQRLAEILERPLWDLDTTRAALIVDAFAEDPRVQRIEVQVNSGDNDIVVERGKEGQLIWAEREVRYQEQELGLVRVAFSRSAYRVQLWRQIWAALGLSIIGMVVVFFSTSLLVRHYLGPPLQELSHLVARYGDTSRLPEPIDFRYREFRPFCAVLQQMGEQIQRQLGELLNHEERLRALLEYSSDIVTITDTEGRIRYEAPVVHKILGYLPGDMEGVSVFELVHPDDRERVRRVFAEGVSSPGLTGMVEYRARHAQGHYVDLESIGSNRLNVPGIEGIVIFTRDITERKRAEQDQRRLQEQLSQAQKMESIGRLAGGVAHDFNNILQAITVYSEMLVEALPPDAETREFASEIGKSAERASALTRQLLAFARKQAIEPRVLDLNEAVSGIIKMLKRLIGEDIDLLWKPVEGQAMLRGDPGQLDQVLANLVVNARDAVGGVGRISIETGRAFFDAEFCQQNPGYQPGDYISLMVTDSGAGMDKETLANIFEPFFTTKGKGEGTGLGLATVYGIVKQNGGFINVYSEIGRGSSFRLYFPAVEGAPAELRQRPPRPAVQAAQGETILLVEDDPQLLSLSRRILSREGYVVLAAPGPEEALQIAAKHAAEIQLLLSDVIMPVMSGRDLLVEISSLIPGIKYLFMSGYTADVVAHRGALEPGFNFLEKPFTVQALTAKVRDVLDA